ncbi:MAG: MFS transporter [Coriobacteriales bacterium]|jgi:MFS family permease
MTEASDVSKTRLILALTALFLSSMCTLGDLVINPIAANLYEVFADQPEWLINLGITGPALVGLPFGLLAGFLCDRMDKKNVMVIGFAIFTVSACLGGAVVNIYYFVSLRLCATGIGWGITNTAALAILADLFTDETEHGKYVGRYNAVMSIMGAIMAAVSGMFAVNGWQHAFSTYLISIPILIMLVVFLPKFPPHEVKTADTADADEEEIVQKGWAKKLIPLTIQVFFVAVCYFVLLYMNGLFVTDAGAGDESFIGLLASAGTLATAVGSLVFGRVYAKMKSAVYLPALFIMGICLLVMAMAPVAAVIMACVIIAGFFWPFYFCYFYTRATELVPASKAGTATSIVALSDGLAATACSYALTGFMGAFNTTSVAVWPIFGVTLLVVGVISCIWFAASNKKNKSASDSDSASA